MFIRNRESIHHHIVRKLKAKYIDTNTFYNAWLHQSNEDPYQLHESQESTQFKHIMNFINLEVSKMLRSKRITEESLTELDSRVAIEIYLREKKNAILEDRMIEADLDPELQVEKETKLQ